MRCDCLVTSLKTVIFNSLLTVPQPFFGKQGQLSLTSPRDALHHGERAANK